MVACPNPTIVLSRRDKAILVCGGLPKPQNRPISSRYGDFALWWPAQAPKSSYLGEIRRFCLWWPAQAPKSSYLGEIKRFCFVVACPNPKIVLSRRDKAILLCGGLPKPQNRPISARQSDFALWWPAQAQKSSYLCEIRRLCFVVACPNPTIVLSRRDKAILVCGGLPKPQNRPISSRYGDFALWWPAQAPKSCYLGEIRRFCLWWPAQAPKSSYLGEIKRFCFVVACPNPKIVLSRRDKLCKPQNRPISAR